MRTINFFIKQTAVALVSAVFVFSSCNKDEEVNTTVVEDKADIQASFDRVRNLVQNFHDGSFYGFAENFLGVGYHEETNYWGTRSYFGMEIPEFTELLGDELEKVLPFGQIEDAGRFKMSSFAGKYTWNSGSKKWDKTAANNSIQVLFPSAENAANNCDVSLTAYTDQACSVEGKNIYLPTKVNSTFTKDGKKIAGIDAAVSYTDYGIPKTASLSVYTKPLTVASTLEQMSASKFTATVSIVDETDGQNSLSLSAEATLSNAINSNTDIDDCKVNYLRVTITQGALVIDGTIDIKTMDNIRNSTTDDINKCINLEVTYNKQKTGTLKLEEVGNSTCLFIYYKDGTSENTEIYYGSFVTEIENIFVER